MFQKRTTQLLLAAALVLIVAFGLIRYAYAPNIGQELSQSGAQTISVSLTVEGLYADTHVEIHEGETVLQMLQNLDAHDPRLALSTKEYAGLGTLVQSMHGVKNGTENKYWQYTVNRVMPQIGADKYVLKNGDAIAWSFALSQE